MMQEYQEMNDDELELEQVCFPEYHFPENDYNMQNEQDKSNPQQQQQ